MKWLVMAVLVLPALARADDAAKPDPKLQAKADVLFETGQADYQAGKYAAAIELFKHAYELVRDPVYLFNIAQSYRKVADCEQATEYYQRYLDESPNAENRAKVKQWLVELQPCVERLQEEHAAAQRGLELERERAEQERKRREAAAPPTVTEVDRGAPYRTAGFVAGAAGALGLVVGIVYTVKGSNLQGDLAARCAVGCDWDSPNIRSLDQDGHQANTFAAIGWIGGGLAVAAGAALYVYGRTKIEHLTVAPTAGGATVGATLRF